jgi:hypothetical protein
MENIEYYKWVDYLSVHLLVQFASHLTKFIEFCGVI